MPSARSGGRRCASRIARSSDTCGTRAVIRLIGETPEQDEFRSLFGDERADYAESLSAYYESGAPDDWQEQFVSAYANSHAWEDCSDAFPLWEIRRPISSSVHNSGPW
jgi:putative zinc-binding metallo-peptidase